MTQPVESFAQVVPDAGGKRVRMLAITALEPDGTMQTVYMQVAAIIDPISGIPIDVQAGVDFNKQVLRLLRALVKGQQIIADFCAPAGATEDLLDDDAEIEG